LIEAWAVPIKTKRWNDPVDPDDGFRLLICRYRPRGVAKADETWNAWDPGFGPSKTLHRSKFPKTGSPISWPEYLAKYRQEQKGNKEKIAALATRAKSGETITLLCTSNCTRESRCHRSILRDLIQAAMNE
jgi:uncharacterized protein YeaO (DUF488 family)